MITRSRFAAYDPAVWQVQTYLAALGIDPGPIDGLWGPQTRSAVQAFRELSGLPTVYATDAGSLLDEGFMMALSTAMNDAGIASVTPPASLPSGSGVSPVTTPPIYTTAPYTPPAGGAPATASVFGDNALMLPLAAVGLGAVLVFGEKRGGRARSRRRR